MFGKCYTPAGFYRAAHDKASFNFSNKPAQADPKKGMISKTWLTRQ